MSWWDSMGETLGGVFDTVGNSAGDLWDAVVDSEVDRIKSSAPEENRPKQDAAQQPGGQPVPQGAIVPNHMLLYAGGGLLVVVLLLVMFSMMKGK
ncbi:hypothetical protein [Photobacterium halotolerans]|uniref:Uncharacterized protein n=1 Tax=Photobacterium halotolerans TaxID=265726 RepID=A0A7X4W9Y3_9GAMM|nr:hypothetical protein [Photobacterium halotolerans]NAW64522.1 hypothetical protein [Photobacterium halotolerans]NAW87163.1 hypothetical protein [Photobacterium halotolerans]